MDDQFLQKLMKVLDHVLTESLPGHRPNVVDGLFAVSHSLNAVADEIEELRHTIRNHTHLMEESTS